MSRFTTLPHPLLRPYVRSYWGFARELPTMRTFTITPDCFLEVIFFVDPPFAQAAGEVERLPACTLVPLLGEPVHLVLDGAVRCAAVRFETWAAGAVLARTRDVHRAWRDASVAFAPIVPAVSAALRREAWNEITILLDAFLLEFLDDAQAEAPAARAVRDFVASNEAAVGTASVATQHGRSRRQIERQVRALTNRSPKQLACLSRFQLVRDALWANPARELDELALEAGYCDQAHLSRHFRRYAGRTASEFKADCIRRKAFLRGEDVAFVQDGGGPGVLRSHT